MARWRRDRGRGDARPEPGSDAEDVDGPRDEEALRRRLEAIAAKAERAIEVRYKEVDSEFAAALGSALAAAKAELAREEERIVAAVREASQEVEPLVLEQLAPRLEAAVETRFRQQGVTPILAAAARELQEQAASGPRKLPRS